MFIGRSGAGKSTMAASFHDRGFRILTDDVCVVTMDPMGGFLAQPGIPRLRLIADAVVASGRRIEELEPAFDDWNKYNVSLAGQAAPDAIPIGSIYLLDRAEDDEKGLQLERLTGSDAVNALMTNIYRGAYLRRLAGKRNSLLACISLADSVPVFRARRVWGHGEIDPHTRILEQHARSIGGCV